MTLDEVDHGETDRADSAAPTAPLFALTTGRTKGYERRAVDAFVAQARDAFEAVDPQTDGISQEPNVTEVAAHAAFSSEMVRRTAFPLVRHGYLIASVDAALARIEDAFAALERERVVTTAGPAEWVGSTRATAQVVLDRLSRPSGRRFEKVSVLRYGYRVDEVDMVADKLARYLESGESVTVEQVRAVAFRMQRGGYREVQVDAVLDSVVEVMLAVA